jgi:hypothetical protein
MIVYSILCTHSDIHIIWNYHGAWARAKINAHDNATIWNFNK